ncbi:MAG TPA: hypothetical protein DC057_01555 [Spirochaetia bacterium]|nr:hypothetical protein [Spirochaetia bacterium]
MDHQIGTTFFENFKKAYNDLYNIHPQIKEEDFRLRYLKADWFFPNHINNVLLQIREIRENFFKDSNIEICLYAGLFHDAGLVYKRELSDATGHENRSVEYAEIELRKMGYDINFIEKVMECIKATEPDYHSDLLEAQLVRNADAYAHLISMHFFAKANFSKDIHSFIIWFENKLSTTYLKITIPELKNKIEPLIKSYKEMIKNYYNNKNDDAFFERLFSR